MRTVCQEKRELPGGQEIHLWRADLDEISAGRSFAQDVLSASERERARRFVFEEHRRRYAAGRAWLRSVLGACLDRPALDVPLTANAHGKPCLAEEANPIGLRFNLSHAGPFALLAVTMGQEIGIDLEAPQRDTDWAAMAALFCTAAERDYMGTLAPETRAIAFTQIWTRKEAAGKALGQGLNSRIFSVSIGPANWGTIDCGEGLVVWSLPPQNGLVAAVAVCRSALPTGVLCACQPTFLSHSTLR
jgi:4'-phosphopantetheinyl transferase